MSLEGYAIRKIPILHRLVSLSDGDFLREPVVVKNDRLKSISLQKDDRAKRKFLPELLLQHILFHRIWASNYSSSRLFRYSRSPQRPPVAADC